MQLALSKCMRVGVSSLAFLEALEDLKTFLLDPGCNMDGVDFTKFLDENDGIVSRLPNMSLQEWALILDIFSTLLSKRTEIPNYEFCRLAAAILKCMYNHTSPAFWDLCLKRFLCKMDARSISSPSLIIHVIVNHSTDINACLQDPTINATFSHFLLTVIEAHGLHKEAFDFSEYTKLGRFIQLMLRFVRQGHSDVLELLATLSGSIIETSFRLQVPKTTLLSKEFFETSQGIVLFTLKYFKCNPTAGLTSLRNLIHLNPKILLLKPVHIHLVDFLLSLLRAPVCSSSTKQNIPCSPTDALSLFSDLLQQIEEFGLKEAVTLPMYMNFFDILRAFPVDESHSISRLYVWWRFICLLPSQMLSGGFRRFVSPFLANLLGRYISITACLGDPILHRYQLSSTSVYNGDARAQELAVHVFSCLFNYSPITLKQASNEEPLPRFSSPPHFLSEHSYQLLVAACHWLRYVSGSDRFTCSPKIGEIWLTYLKQIQNAALAFKPDDETLKGTFLHHFVDLSVRLITPHLQNCASTSFGSLIVPSVEDISCSPTTNDCVIILHGVIGIVENEKISSELKTTLNFNICVSCLHLLSLRHRSSVSSPMSAEHTFMDELSRLSIQLAEKDYRLAVEHSPIVNTCDHLKLFQELLSALAPDCIHFIRDTLVPDSSQDSIPPKSSIRSVNTRLNEAGIRAWCFLADRLARLTSLHKRVVELPKPGTESVGIPDTPTSDLFTMVAFCLAPLFLAGNSTCSLSVCHF
uniref:Methyl methanesulfonate-sensitivity protein 22-like n=3 Tax=Mesocestoides corti TaxID=53468 RepID=A0A5K3FZ50_MESCO